MKWFTRSKGQRPALMELPDVCKRLMSLSELRAVLTGQKDNPQVQACLQLMSMQRAVCMSAAQAEAMRGGGQTHYQLGGVAGVEDAISEVLAMLDGRPPSDDVKGYFPTDSGAAGMKNPD